MLEHADAALIIGDAALVLDPAELPFHVLDLGAEWVANDRPADGVRGLGRARRVAGAGSQAIPRIMRFGLAHIDDIARSEHAKVGVSEDLARSYLRDNIVFELGDREYAGLKTFLQYASELGALVAGSSR